MNFHKYFLLCFLLLGLCRLSYTERFYITTEQLQTLEQNSKKQRELLAQQSEELITLKAQLNESKNQMTNLQEQLTQVNESLKKSESKKLTSNIYVGFICAIVGAGIGFVVAR